MSVNDQPVGDVEMQNKQRWNGIFDRVKNEGIEGLFYFTLLVGVAEGGLILWDLFTMMPWFVRLAGLKAANTLVASPDMSNIYLGFLTVYCGGKEVKRWFDRSSNVAAVSSEELEARVQWFSRGMAIVFGWQALLVMAVVVKDLHLVSRMPNELFRVAMQSLALWAGTYVSGKAHQKSLKKKMQGTAVPVTIGSQDAAPEKPVEAVAHSDMENNSRVSDHHRQVVLAYLGTTEWINREQCEMITGLGKWQAHRLLSNMEENKELECDGNTKARRYRKKTAQKPAKPPAQEPPK